MAHTSKPAVRWLDRPEEHDYPAAASYLSLVAAPGVVEAVIEAFRAADSAHFKAKDILRASRLALLATDNPHVASDLKKIADGEALSPVLLVRGDAGSGREAQIADGYHRVCASYHTDENTDVPVRIVDLHPSHAVTPGAVTQSVTATRPAVRSAKGGKASKGAGTKRPGKGA